MALYSMTIWVREVFFLLLFPSQGETLKKKTIRQNQMGCKDLQRYHQMMVMIGHAGLLVAL